MVEHTVLYLGRSKPVWILDNIPALKTLEPVCTFAESELHTQFGTLVGHSHAVRWSEERSQANCLCGCAIVWYRMCDHIMLVVHHPRRHDVPCSPRVSVVCHKLKKRAALRRPSSALIKQRLATTRQELREGLKHQDDAFALFCFSCSLRVGLALVGPYRADGGDLALSCQGQWQMGPGQVP